MSGLRDSVSKVNGDYFDATVEKPADGELQATVEGHKDIGKPGGWTLGGGWQYVKDKGSTVFGKLSWRPRSNSQT